MDLDDLFEGKRHGGRGHHGRDDHADRTGGGHGEHASRGPDEHRAPWDGRGEERHGRHALDHADAARYLELLRANKGLVFLGGLLLVLLTVGLLAVALPLLGKAVGAVDQNGLKGLVERLWLGSGGR